MKALSPVDAIAPAFSRTRTVLLPPPPAGFRFWFFIKIALVAALTSAGFYGATVSLCLNGLSLATMMAGGHLHRTQPSFLVAPGFAATLIAAFAALALVVVAFSLLMGWLWSRLRFTLFDLVVFRQGQVGPAWSRYGSQAWRYLGLMAVAGLAFALLVTIAAGPLFLHFVVSLRHLTPQQINADPSVIFEHIFPMYGVIIIFGLLGAVVDAVMQDFLLPPMALENAPLDRTISRFFGLLQARFWTLALYLLLRFVIEVGLTWVGMMAVFLMLLILGGGGAGIGFLLYQSLWQLGPVGITLFLLFCGVAGAILLALYLLAMTSLYGVIGTFKQCYAAYFYGSWYPELGDRLEPPVEPPPQPAPAPPPMAPPLTPLGEPPPIA